MKKVLLIFLLFTIALLPAAAESRVLDLESCIELALENNPDFRISAISLKAAERNSSAGWNNFLPGISAGGGISGSSPLFTDQPAFSWSINGSFSLSLSLNPGIAQNLAAIRLEYEKENISYESARKQLISSVENEFYYLITGKSNLEIIKSNLELAQKNYEQAQSNYNYGMTSELSVLQAEVSAANLEPAYKQALAAYAARIKEFALILGISPDSELILNGTLDAEPVTFNAQMLAAKFLSNRDDIAALEKEIEILKNNRKLTSSNRRLPSLNLSTGYSVSGFKQWSDRFTAGLSVNIPIDDLIPGSSTSLSLSGLDDQIAQAEIRLAKTFNEAETEIINLVMQLETYASNMKLSEMNIKLAEKSYLMSEESYTHGTIKRLDVEDAQQAYLSAKNQHLSSQYEYLSALIKLRDALGLENLNELYLTGVKSE